MVERDFQRRVTYIYICIEIADNGGTFFWRRSDEKFREECLNIRKKDRISKYFFFLFKIIPAGIVRKRFFKTKQYQNNKMACGQSRFKYNSKLMGKIEEIISLKKVIK